MIYVSNSDDLKKLTMREFHAKPYFGHPGHKKTVMAIKKYYYWPNLEGEITYFISKYIEC